MAILTLQIDNTPVLEHLKKVLSLMKGVSIVNVSDDVPDDVVDMPNSVTMAAMKEAESGHDAGVVDTGDLQSFINSMK